MQSVEAEYLFKANYQVDHSYPPLPSCQCCFHHHGIDYIYFTPASFKSS